MKILGIETSCDETAAAIVENGTNILSNVVASSLQLHVKTDGIIPEVAAREQIKYLIPVIAEAVENCKLKIENLDALAVTVGPGLIGSLLVGVETAKTLAYLWQKPIIPVNHLVAHLYANWLTISPKRSDSPSPPSEAIPHLPAICLIASGGHTDLVLMKGHAAPATPVRSAGGRGKLRWLGGTRDDAAGEAFDKTARLLGLPYPGGPAIAAKAAKLPATSYQLPTKFPRPMIETDDFDFSFSGLKTAVLREVNKLKTMKQFNNDVIKQLSFEVQEAITDVLVDKTLRAAEKYKVKSILLGGGVTANQRLKNKFQSSIIDHKLSISLFIPPPRLCTDNAAIIASAAFFNYNPVPWDKITADPGLHF